MKKTIFLLIILTVPYVFASVDNYNNNSEINVKINMTFNSFLTYETDSANIDEVKLTTKFFPRNTDFQEVLDLKLNSKPSASIKKTEDLISCKWDKPSLEMSFNIDSLVKSKNDFVRIKNKISFPPPSFSKELKKYTQYSKNIDITPEIKAKANEIIEGETDYLIAITRIADFVKKYVKYELNLKTEEGVKPASWVYTNKQGACDEISSLFMAFLRSLGIPVRFVSGVAYSNVYHSFGNHGWTEIYYPKYGWIPFDVTYGQYGWVDPTHIVFLYSVDPSDSSIDYSWKSSGVKLNTKPLEINSSVASTTGKMPSLLDIELRPLQQNIKIKSYMVVQATVKNNNDYYFPFTAYISKAPALVNNDTSRQYIIPPRSKRNFYWIIKPPKNLNKNYVYTTTIELTTNLGNKFETKINYADSYEYFSYNWAQTKLKRLQKREEKFNFKDLEFDCVKNKDIYYPSEQANITCFVKNKGNTRIKDLSVCLNDECKIEMLSINELKQINFIYNVSEKATIKLTAEDEDMIKSTYLNINTVQIPEVFISDINPKVSDYKNKNFDVLLSTDIPIYNLTLNINNIYGKKIDILYEPQNISVEFESKNLMNKPLFVNLTYHDKYGKTYNRYKIENIEVVSIPWYIKLKIYFLELFN
jgi:hypothetical protein